jgi:hypothetical protein
LFSSFCSRLCALVFNLFFLISVFLPFALHFDLNMSVCPLSPSLPQSTCVCVCVQKPFVTTYAAPSRGRIVDAHHHTFVLCVKEGGLESERMCLCLWISYSPSPFHQAFVLVSFNSLTTHSVYCPPPPPSMCSQPALGVFIYYFAPPSPFRLLSFLYKSHKKLL